MMDLILIFFNFRMSSGILRQMGDACLVRLEPTMMSLGDSATCKSCPEGRTTRFKGTETIEECHERKKFNINSCKELNYNYAKA